MDINTVLNAVQSLQKLSQADIKFNTALTISKNLDEVQKVIDLFEEKKKTIIEPLGEDPANAPKEEQEAANNKILELVKEEVDIDIKKVKIADLEDVKVTPSEVSAIRWMLEEDA